MSLAFRPALCILLFIAAAARSPAADEATTPAKTSKAAPTKTPESRIAAALDGPTAIEFVDTPLKEVCDYLQDLHHIPVRIDVAALKKAGIAADVLITANHRNLTLQSALNLTLAQPGLTHVFDREALWITTPGGKAARLKQGAIDPQTLALPGRDAAQRRLLEKLKQPFRMKVPATPATEFLETITDITHIEIAFDRNNMTLRDLAADLSIGAQNQPLEAALRQAFAAREIEFACRDEAIVIGVKKTRPAVPWQHGAGHEARPEEEKQVAALKRLKATFNLNEYGRVNLLIVRNAETFAIVPQLEDLTNLTIDALDLGDPFDKPGPSKPWLDDAMVARLAPAVQLTELTISNAPIGDAAISHLAPLKQLESLGFARTNITNAGLAALMALPKLRSLDLSGTKIDDAGLPALTDLPHLWSLDLVETPVTSAGLKALLKFQSRKQLTCINLSQTKVDDEGMKYLAAMPGLSNIYLCHTRVTDAGLKALATAPISYLELDGDAITDDGLAHLEAIGGLVHLSVRGTKVTRAGVDRLREALPKCEVKSDFAEPPKAKGKADGKADNPFGR